MGKLNVKTEKLLKDGSIVQRIIRNEPWIKLDDAMRLIESEKTKAKKK